MIETPVLLDGKQWKVEISLASRENMSFRMLLGRSALRKGGLMVDPGRSYLTGKRIRKAYPKVNKISKKQFS